MRRDLAARGERAVDTARLLARSVLDTNPVPDWEHVTKVDPEGAKKLPLLYPLWLAETDAVSVGGSSDVTPANTAAAFDLLAPLSTPVCHEPSGADHVTEQSHDVADLLLVPEVLNGDSEALVGTLGTAIESVREELAPELIRRKASWLPDRVADWLAGVATSLLLSEAAFEAYIVQNPDSAAARESGVGAEDLLDPTDAKRRAMAADRHLESEIVYLEYSGTFGGDEAVETLERIDGALVRSRVWYGGGLANAEDVRAVREAGADTVVVGDAFHRVAEREADLLEQAATDLDADASPETIREWVADRVDAEGSGARFLSTVPGVDDPVALAREYTGTTVRAWLELRARSRRAREGSGEPTVDVQDTTLRAALAPIVDDPDALAAAIARGALAGPDDVVADGSRRSDQLSASLVDAGTSH
ncbi:MULTISPECIES: geranylgeranylglyceryl/heptaprenylglyceryl phosphate synthase [Halolamina]|uniref:phosphoglycerol geranylgeranyltransferase n=1 Tax=Halolamina pelagica TaxID=699431 RepID=A0A1I5M6G1_9EURY|nr:MULTISPECIES: geranylgeranylglyceryl/heptaprenylglyceryl phosphate synthase [Halolamina]NHX35888.1 oxidoreductase [Halolamina sp. R1-12]SFP05172.1 phosphoglycerol geranylgeranyltransferase [Halolamina pelagica]